MRRLLAPLAAVLGLGLAVLAVVAAAPTWLCAVAAGGAVAIGDLAALAAEATPDADRAQEARVLRAHLGALAAGLAPGIALAALLGRAHFALPFGAVLALGLGAVVALDRAWRRL